jgi:hypothetical protein
MSVYGRLGYTKGSAVFNGADQLTANTLNFINNSNINLSQWQINDLSNATVGGYYQNPHNTNLATLAIYLNGLAVLANTSNTVFANTATAANTLSTAIVNAENSLFNFTVHTNNLSGVTFSANTTLYPDLNSGLAVGRQILNITNKTDSIQDNTPIMGNFTSLYIGSALSNSTIAIVSDYATLNNSISLVSGNATSNITNTAINTIITDVTNLQTLMDTQRNGDINFYTNSCQVLQDYQTLLQFSNMGASQNSLIKLIGASKLHSELGY